MSSFLGMGYRVSLNPYWFNANTGEIVQTPGQHHSSVFPRAPERLGLAAEEVRFKVGGEAFTNAFATVMLTSGWCRIDIASDDDQAQSFVGGTLKQLPPGAVAVVAPTTSAAHAALLKLPELTSRQVSQVSVVISATATKDRRDVRTVLLQGREIPHAASFGLGDWFPGDTEAPARASKMVSNQRRGCPFGFSG